MSFFTSTPLNSNVSNNSMTASMTNNSTPNNCELIKRDCRGSNNCLKMMNAKYRDCINKNNQMSNQRNKFYPFGGNKRIQKRKTKKTKSYRRKRTYKNIRV